jgi:hypothetical protein
MNKNAWVDWVDINRKARRKPVAKEKTMDGTTTSPDFFRYPHVTCPKIQTLQFLGDIGSTAYFVVVLHFVMGVRLSW